MYFGSPYRARISRVRSSRLPLTRRYAPTSPRKRGEVKGVSVGTWPVFEGETIEPERNRDAADEGGIILADQDSLRSVV
jgi:hypothetical protein